MLPLEKIGNSPTKKTTIALWLGVFIIASVLLLFKLGSYNKLKKHEAYVGVAAQEMRTSGDWLIPHFGGHPRLQKPPLSYWMVAGLGWWKGSIDEWTVRLPSAIAGLLLVGLIGAWGTRWYGIRTGLCAAFMTATSAYVITWSRLGVIDMPLTLLTVSGLYLGAIFCCSQTSSAPSGSPVNNREASRRGCIPMYLVLGVSGLAKPGIGLILAILPCAVFLILQRRLRNLLRLMSPIGISIAAVFTLLWPILAATKHPQLWNVWYYESIGRAIGETRYNHPFWYYTSGILVSTLPWTPLILLEVPSSWRRAWKEDQWPEQFLWTWFLTDLLVLSLFAGKAERYILPALPALTLMGSRRLQEMTWWFNPWNSTTIARPALVALEIFLFVGITLAVGFDLGRNTPTLRTFMLSISLLFGVCGTAIVWAWSSGWRREILGATLLLFIGGYVMVVNDLLPRYDPNRPAVDFAVDAAGRVPQDRELVVFGVDPSYVTFYLRHHFELEPGWVAIQKRLRHEGSVYILTAVDSLPRLRTAGKLLILRQMGALNSSGHKPQGSLLLALLYRDPAGDRLF